MTGALIDLAVRFTMDPTGASSMVITTGAATVAASILKIPGKSSVVPSAIEARTALNIKLSN